MKKSQKQIFIRTKRQTKNNTQEFIHKVNILDAKTLLDFASMDTKIAPKFKHIFADDEYYFGTIEHFVNNCNLKNLNNITAIDNNWDDEWSDLHQYDVVVASQPQDIENVKSALEKLHSKTQNKDPCKSIHK